LLISSLSVAASALLRARADILEQEALLYATTKDGLCIIYIKKTQKYSAHN
jgi:hypothetical protein